MELIGIRYLLEIVEAGSFAKASTCLALSSFTLSRWVAALEDELGLAVLERSRAGVRLTSGGAVVMIEIRRLLTDLDAVPKAAQCNGVGKFGELRLGVRIPPVGEPLRSLLAE